MTSQQPAMANEEAPWCRARHPCYAFKTISDRSKRFALAQQTILPSAPSLLFHQGLSHCHTPHKSSPAKSGVLVLAAAGGGRHEFRLVRSSPPRTHPVDRPQRSPTLQAPMLELYLVSSAQAGTVDPEQPAVGFAYILVLASPDATSDDLRKAEPLTGSSSKSAFAQAI